MHLGGAEYSVTGEYLYKLTTGLNVIEVNSCMLVKKLLS